MNSKNFSNLSINHSELQSDPVVLQKKCYPSEMLKQNLYMRLNRIEGQIRGLKGMIGKEAYCDDVITQIAAAQAALNGVAKVLLEDHLRNFVVERIQQGDQEAIDQLLTTIQRLIKK